MYELSDKLLNNLKLSILENWEIKKKSREWLDFMSSTQRATKKHLYAKNQTLKFFGEKSQKISCETFHRKTYFAYFCEVIYKYLYKTVVAKIHASYLVATLFVTESF